MGFCSNCRVEYLPEIKICIDCGSKLVDELLNVVYAEWMALPCVPGVVHAQTIKKALEKMNIQCYIQSLWSSAHMREISSTLLKCAAAKVVVPKPHYDEAFVIQEIMIEQSKMESKR